MKKTAISLVAFAFALIGSNASAAYNAPTLNVNDEFVTEEGLRLTAALLGEDGFIEITMDATYLVEGTTTVQHTRSGSTETYNVYKLDGAGTLEGTGNVKITQPIPINGPARIINGTYAAEVFLDVATGAVVKKTRTLSGTAEYQLPNGFWFAIGDLTINENEEYFPPLPEVPFPVAAGNTGSASTQLYVFGSIDAAGLINTELDTDLSLNPSYTVSADSFTVGGSALDVLKTVHMDSANSMELTTWYSCEANYAVNYEISNLPIGDEGTLEYVRVKVVDFIVADDSCGGTQPTEPTLALTSPKTAYSANDMVSWTFSIDNTGGPELNGNAWLVLELFGEYYFFNYSSGAFLNYSRGEGLTSTPRTVPANAVDAFKFLEFEFPGIGSTISLTWIFGWQKGDGTFLNQFPMVTTTHP